MKPKSQFETADNSASQALWQLTVLISELRRKIHNFENSIEAEEDRAQVFEPANANYPVLARDFKARRDNLLVTIAMLENQLARADASTA
jgi:hypothetical protein